MRVVEDIERVRRVVGGVALQEQVLAETVAAAAVLRTVRATRPGFAFELYVCVGDAGLDVRGAARGLYGWGDDLRTTAGDAMVCRVQFSDGRMFGSDSSQDPQLYMLAGSGTQFGWASWFWVPDVPTDGDVVIEFWWASAGLVGSAVLAAATMISAQKKSRVLFNETRSGTHNDL